MNDSIEREIRGLHRNMQVIVFLQVITMAMVVLMNAKY